VRDEALSPDGRIQLSEALPMLTRLAWRSNRIWANGITFDIGILENAYAEHKQAVPWKYYKVMDARTIFKVASADKLKNSHNALEDCRNQIEMLRSAFRSLGITQIA
jgi:hypothetical protein